MNSSAHAVLGYLHSLLSRHSGEQDDDRELLHRFVESRDGDAFALLMRRHGPMVLGLARRILGDAHLAEDVFQAAFLLLARKARTIRRAESLSCWLHGVAFRLALRVRRSHRRRQERETHFHPPASPSPLEELTAQELLTVLDEELHKLPEIQRAPLILCCLEGLSQEEAARRLGCSSAAVKGRLERGRQRLRLRLEKRGLTLPAVFGGTLLIAGATKAVPVALMQTTLHAATSGSGVAPTIAALMKGVMQTMFLHKLKMASAALVLLAAAGGFAMVMLREKEQPEQPPALAILPEKPPAQEAEKDLYGDPLPKGAILRLGTLRRRAVGARLAVNSDGQSIVGVRGRKYIYIWDAITGKLCQTRELPGEGVAVPVLSPDGKMLALAEKSEQLAIWDVRSGKRLQTLAFKGTRSIFPIAFSNDGKTIAAVGHRQSLDAPHDDLVRVWNLGGGKEIFRKDIRNNNQSYLLAFSPDDRRLLGSFNNSQGSYCCCWDMASGRQLWQNKNNFWSFPFVFTPDGKVLFPQQPSQQKVVVVDLATGQSAPMEKPPPLDWDTKLALTTDGRILLISTSKGVIVWDMVHGKEQRTLLGAGEEVVVMADGKSIITNDGSLQRWDLTTGKPLWTDTFALGHIGEVTAVAFSANGRRLSSVSTDGSVRLWDATTGKLLRYWRGHVAQRWIKFLPETDGVKTEAITPDGRYVLSGGSDEHLKLWDASSAKEVRSIALPARQDGEDKRYIFHVWISPDASRAVGLFGARGFHYSDSQTRFEPTNKLAAWNLKTGELLVCHPVKLTSGRSNTISPDGRLLLSNGVIVDVATGKEIVHLEGEPMSPCAFAHDGALAIGGCTRTVQKDGASYQTADGLRVWETATGKTIAHLKMDPWIGLASFHPDNRFAVTSDLNGIRLWDVASGKLVSRWKIPESILSSSAPLSYAGCLAFTADGRRLATGLPDSTTLLWDVPPLSSPSELLTVKDLETLWDDLAGDDAAKAWRSVWRMAKAPKDAMVFLRGRVKPSPTAAADVTRKLLADLDSDSFAAREAAAKRLKELGLQAEPALRAALKAKPSLEQRRRIEPILAALSEMPQKLTPDELRQLRALIVLERIGSPEARRLLEEAANGPPSARLTRQARACLACLHE